MTKKLTLICALIAWSISVFSQSFEIQLINNTAPANNGPGALVDIYLNDSLFATTQALDFMEATPLISLPTDESLKISIATAPSDSVQQSFAIFNFGAFEADKIYSIVIDGGFGDPNNPLRIELTEGLLRFSPNPDQISIRAYNGNNLGLNNDFYIQRQGFIVEDLDKGDFGTYQSWASGVLLVDLFESNNSIPTSTYSFDFSGAAGQAFTLLNGFDRETDSDVVYAVNASGMVIEGELLALPDILINEIDYNQPGPDGAEFVELKNIGGSDLSLAGLSLEFWNGSVDQTYNNINLPAITLAANDYYVVCFNESVANCDLLVNGSIQNGGTSPDGVLLLAGAAVVDALSYEGNIPLVTEGDATSLADNNALRTGLSRIPDGLDSNNNGLDFQAVCVTPGTVNQAETDCATISVDSISLQIINNNEGGAIDVYLGMDLLASAIDYQSGTAFLRLPVGPEHNLSFVESGSPLSAAFLNEQFVLHTENNYLVVLEGTFNDAQLVIYDQAQTQSRSPFAGDFNVYHGIEAGPQLDLLIKSVGLVANGLQYQEFSGYGGALPGTYLIELITPSDGEVIATFELDMRQAAGKAETILISNEATDSNSLELISIDADGVSTQLELVEFASVQLIHNIPNIVVDIYIDDRLIADNVNYRSASSFLEVRANTEIVLEVKGEDSTPASESVLSFEGLRFSALSASVVVLGGDGTDDRPVDIFTFDGAQLTAQSEDKVDLAFFHGATDIDPLALSSQQLEPILPSLNFGQFSPYQSFDASDLVFFVEGGMPLANLDFYGGDLSAKMGQSGVVFSSGVLGGSETFGLFIAFADGEVIALDTLDFARIQMVHNVSNEVRYDVYLNDSFFAGPLGFQEATPYLNIQAGLPLDLRLVPAGAIVDSAVLAQENLIFLKDATYQVFVNGQLEMPDQPGALFLDDQATEINLADSDYGIKLFHGALDVVDLDFQLSNGSVIGENIAYGQFAQTSGLAPANTIIELVDSDRAVSLCGFELPLLNFPQASQIVIFTSVRANAARSLELLAVLPDGQVIPLSKTTFARLQIVNLLANSNSPVDVYLDGERIADDLDFRSATAYQTIRAGQDHTLAIAAASSTDASAPLLSQLITSPASEEILAAFVAPSIDDTASPYQVFLNKQASIDAGGANKFTFNFFNGIFDQLDLDLALQGITTLYRNVPYGSFSDYTLVEPLSSDPRVTFELTSAQSTSYQGDFFADFSAYDNLGTTIFASGFIANDLEPAAALWIVLPDGTTAPLELIVNTEDLSELLPVLTLSPNPSTSLANLDFLLEKRTSLTVHLISAEGKVIEERRLPNLSPGNYRESFDVDQLPSGMYFLNLQAEGKRSVLKLNVHR